jgi:hypothetical protein
MKQKKTLFQPNNIFHSHYTGDTGINPPSVLTIRFQQPKVKDTINWKILNQLEYKEQEHEAYGTVMMPVFSKEVKNFDKKRVVIKGYILPVDRKTYALSKNVYAACFFCGKAGPETVMGLTFKESPGRIKMDTYATLSGILKINGTDVEDWMYSLTDVEIIHMKE